MGADLVLLVI